MSGSRYHALRGLMGMALTWTIIWIPLGLVVTVLDTLRWDRPVTGKAMIDAVPSLALFGAVSGFFFGIVLHLMERRREFAKLTNARIALWGLLAGAALPMVFLLVYGVTAALSGFIVFGMINAVAAVTTLSIARRAPSGSLSAGAEVKPAISK